MLAAVICLMAVSLWNVADAQQTIRAEQVSSSMVIAVNSYASNCDAHIYLAHMRVLFCCVHMTMKCVKYWGGVVGDLCRANMHIENAHANECSSAAFWRDYVSCTLKKPQPQSADTRNILFADISFGVIERFTRTLYIV